MNVGIIPNFAPGSFDFGTVDTDPLSGVIDFDVVNVTSIPLPSPSDDTVDADSDGIPDDCDVCPFDALDDADGDGVCGDMDLCEGFETAIPHPSPIFIAQIVFDPTRDRKRRIVGRDLPVRKSHDIKVGA